MRGLALPNEYGIRTIPALLSERARSCANSAAIIAKSEGTPYQALTYSELQEHTISVAAGLRNRGIGVGDHVAWLLDNSNGLDAMILYHALLYLGAVNVPINVRLTRREVADIFRHSKSRAILMKDGYADLAADIPSEQKIEVSGPGLLSSLHAAGQVEAPMVDDLQPAALLYTSGTTGDPRGVLHTHGSALAAGIAWSDALRIQEDEVLQSPFPIFGGAGLHFNALSVMFGGGTFAIDDYDTANSLKLIDQLGTKIYVAVPAIYSLWLESSALSTASLSTVRTLDYGGSAISPSLIERLKHAVPTAGLMQTYGLTEAGPGGLYLPEEYALTRLGSIGSRCAGRFTRVRIVNREGADAISGERGELLLRGPSVMDEYFGDPVATEEAFFDGWLRSGDIVQADRDGFIYYVDRKKDIIVRGGFNISSAEVEHVLTSHPMVSEAAVVGISHAILGEDVRAFVVLRQGSAVEPEELILYCRERLADFKRPRSVVIIESLPRNSAGKVLKRNLRATGVTDSDGGELD